MRTKLYTFALVFSIVLVIAAYAVAEDAVTEDAATEEATEKKAPVVSSERRISMNVAKAEIGDALRLVAEQGGLNLVIGPQVEGEVSVYLTESSLETALKAITINNGFTYTVDDGIISVSKPLPEPSEIIEPELETRIFTLRSQNAERVRDVLEYSLSQYGKIKVLNENSESMYATTSLSSLAGDVADSGGASSTSSSADSSGDATNGSGNLRHARILVVTDIPENLVRVADLIADLDQLPPQVLIEARIVEMSTQLQRELGVDWNINISATGPILNHMAPLNGRAGFASGTATQRRPDGTAYNSAGLALGAIDMSSFIGALRIHQQDNAIRILANPRLLVYNNHSASILVGERYPILESNITDQGTLTEAFDTYIPVGIQLEVTPTIMIDGRVSLLVHPVTSSLGDDVVGTTGLRVARILTREIDTRVIIRDGQTVVLGGLIRDQKTRIVNKVPGLGDIPILDVFFRQENPRTERVDLLVFLTVHVEKATTINERDQIVFEKYKPHFKHIDLLQDVPLHFEIPSEYEEPKPMFGEPPPFEDRFSDEIADESDKPARKQRSIPSHQLDSAVDDRGIRAAHAGKIAKPLPVRHRLKAMPGKPASVVKHDESVASERSGSLKKPRPKLLQPASSPQTTVTQNAPYTSCPGDWGSILNNPAWKGVDDLGQAISLQADDAEVAFDATP